MHVGSGAFTYEVAEPWVLDIQGPNHEVAGVAVNSKDEVHVFTSSPHPVIVFDRRGRFLRSFGEGLFTNPHGIHIRPDDCVYAADSVDSTIRKFSPKDELLFTLGQRDHHSDTGINDEGDHRTITHAGPPFHFPTNAAVAPNNDLYVSDGYGNARIHRYSEDGKLQASWGGPGSGPGQFQIPHSVFIDRHGTVYVADRENSRIQLFDLAGRFLSEWTDVRRPDDVFVTPDDQVFLAEQGYASGLVDGLPDPGPTTPSSRVTVRDLAGQILTTWGANDTPDRNPCAPGNFFAAHGIWVDRHGSVYVGEVVVGGNGREGAGGGAGWVPPTCHAFQVFHRM